MSFRSFKFKKNKHKHLSPAKIMISWNICHLSFIASWSLAGIGLLSVGDFVAIPQDECLTGITDLVRLRETLAS